MRAIVFEAGHVGLAAGACLAQSDHDVTNVDTEGVEKVKTFDQGVDYKDPETLSEFRLSHRTGGIFSPRGEGAEPLSHEAAHSTDKRCRPVQGGRTETFGGGRRS